MIKMRKRIVFILVFFTCLICCVLIINKKNSSVIKEKIQGNYTKEETVMTANITKSEKDYIMVRLIEKPEKEFIVYGDNTGLSTGDYIEIRYDGKIKESDPPRIKAISISKIYK